VLPSNHREFGYAEVTASAPTNCSMVCSIARMAQARRVRRWMSHGDRVETLPPGYTAVAQSANAPLAAMVDEKRSFYAVQFHPEVTHTLQGAKLLGALRARNLRLRPACGASEHHRNDAVTRVRAQVGKGKVLLGLSGGVDSSWSRRCCTGDRRSTQPVLRDHG